MNIGFRIFVVLLYLLAALPNASAQDQASPSPQEVVDQIMKSMDKDGDGTISKTEAPTDLKLFFADYDKNSDGQIDNDEAVAIAKWVEANKTKPGSPADLAQQKAQAKKWIATVDKDGDGKINQKEAPQKLKDYFGMFDTDADGKIDANEALKILPHVNQAAAKNSASDNQTTKPGRLTAEQLIASMDRNGNKSIDSDEAPGELAPHFASIDTNSDDKIYSDEAVAILPHITAEQARGILATLEANNTNQTPCLLYTSDAADE